jgi:imidazolonepropionase-like amidohydrolase
MRFLLPTIAFTLATSCAPPPATTGGAGSTAPAAPAAAVAQPAAPAETTAAPAATTAVPEATPVLFQNVRVFDGTSARLTEPMHVLVTGNTIAQMSASPIAAPAGAQVIEGQGRTLMPGLIDNHVHVTMSAWSQLEALQPDMTPEKLEVRAAAEAEGMLLRGFTAARDLGGPVFSLKAGIDRGKYKGPRLWPSGAMVSQTSGHGDSRLPEERSRRFFGEVSLGEKLGVSFIADGRADVLTAVRENLRFGASQIKVMAGGGAATTYDPLDVSQYTLDELRAAVEAADDWNTYVTVHAYTPRAVRRAVEAGVKSVEHGQLLDEETIALLGQKGVWLSLQVLDPAPPSAPEFTRAKKQQVVDGTDKAYTWARKHKVKLAWGTDMLFDPRQNAKQTAEILKLRQWFTPAEILKMVTHDNAELLALSGPRTPYPGRLGVVAVGALADVLLVEGDPIANLDLLGDPAKNFVVIMKDGRIYKNAVR